MKVIVVHEDQDYEWLYVGVFASEPDVERWAQEEHGHAGTAPQLTLRGGYQAGNRRLVVWVPAVRWKTKYVLTEAEVRGEVTR